MATSPNTRSSDKEGPTTPQTGLAKPLPFFFFIAFADSRTRVNFFAGHPLRSFRQKRTSLRAHLARLHEAHASMMSPTPSDPPPTLKKDDLHFVAMMDRALAEAWRWDETELDEIILSAIESSHRRAEEGEGEWASKLMDRQTRQAPQ